MIYTKVLRVEKAPLVGVEESPEGMKHTAAGFRRRWVQWVDERVPTGSK